MIDKMPEIQADPKELQILHAAGQLYAKYGIKSVTMDDISRHLGISKKTLYQYVTDKTDLVEKVIMRESMERKKDFDAIYNGKLNAIEELLEVNRFVNKLFKDYNPSKEYDLQKYYPEIYQKIRELRRVNMYQASRNNILKGQKQGIYRKDLDADMISKLHVFRVENLIEFDLFRVEEITSDHFCNELMKYHIYGIANEKGIKYYNEQLNNQ